MTELQNCIADLNHIAEGSFLTQYEKTARLLKDLQSDDDDVFLNFVIEQFELKSADRRPAKETIFSQNIELCVFLAQCKYALLQDVV